VLVVFRLQTCDCEDTAGDVADMQGGGVQVVCVGGVCGGGGGGVNVLCKGCRVRGCDDNADDATLTLPTSTHTATMTCPHTVALLSLCVHNC
jgi:hypothetical protein